jgi:hypothetical protein
MRPSLITAVIALAAIAISPALMSCAPSNFNSVKFSAITPYGDISSVDGQIAVAVRPLVIATK